MAGPRLIPSLADLTQDIAGPIPVDLLTEWVSGRQDVDKATRLLAPFEIRGTVVSSDTSGLTELTEHADLVDVLALISLPKEIVHAVGTEIGGRAIGTWVADNTQMFYPSSLDIETVASAMAEAQARVGVECAVRIGMCMHEGAFYEIGGGLYGKDADLVECLAETYAGPGDILVTEPSASRLLARGGYEIVPRPDLHVIHEAGVSNIVTAPGMAHLLGQSRTYPHPYPDAFFRTLLALRQRDESTNTRDGVYQTWLRDRTIVFLARDRQRLELSDIAALLDNLSANAVFEAIVSQSADARGHVASLGGGLAILVFEHPEPAVAVARKLREAFQESGLDARVGIDVGPILEFTNEHGPSGLAGDAVNIASKLSEDIGVNGAISLTARAAAKVPNLGAAEPFHAVVSRVPLEGVRI